MLRNTGLVTRLMLARVLGHPPRHLASGRVDLSWLVRSLTDHFGPHPHGLRTRAAGFCIPGPDPEPPKLNPGRPESGPRGPGEAYIFIGELTDWSPPDRQAEVWDPFGHSQGDQVKGHHSRY